MSTTTLASEHAPPAGAGAETLPRYVRWSIIAALVSVTIISRAGVNVGEYTVNFALPILYFMIVKGWMDGEIRLEKAPS